MAARTTRSRPLGLPLCYSLQVNLHVDLHFNLQIKMRAAVILGLGCSPKDLRPFQCDASIEWRMGMPAPSDQADVILLFGGDGTIHRHLGQLVKINLPVLIVPAGSGNDFARSLGLRRVRDSLAAWQGFCAERNNVRAIDLGVIAPPAVAGEALTPRECRYFCCVSSVGLDTEVARRANRLPRWLRAHGGYVLSLAPTVFSFAPLPMKILDDDESAAGWVTRSNRPTTLAAFANTPTYGGGMKIAPRAKMDDGLLDVCVVGSISPFKLARLFPTVYGGRHLSIREVDYFQAVRVRVETEHPVDVYADGEYVCRTPAELRVERGVLRAIVRETRGA
jgi:diacylglycerol kinase (ATP)